MFKIGDEVEVVKVLEGSEDLEEASKHVGEKGVIEEIIDYNEDEKVPNVLVKTPKGSCYFIKSELKLIKPKQFTKDDLQGGMVVELRGGNKAIIFEGKILFEREDEITFNYVRLLTNNLEFDNHSRKIKSSFDIMKVYNNPQEIELLWEREEKPTKEDIEEMRTEVENYLYDYLLNKKSDLLSLAIKTIQEFANENHK